MTTTPAELPLPRLREQQTFQQAGLAPTWRHLAIIFFAAVAVRVLLLVVVSRLQHHGLFFLVSQNGTDSFSYIEYARLFSGETPDLAAYDQRVFPGYPAFMAALHFLRIPIELAGLLLSWTGAGLLAVGGAVLYKDWRMGWALVFLIPHYLITSTIIMNESVFLSLSVFGIIAGLRGRPVIAGILIGAAGATRPNACFALAGYVAYGLLAKRRARAAVVTAISGLMVLAFLGLLWFKLGDPLVNVKAYKNDPNAFAGQLLTWPFVSLVMTPIRTAVPLWKIIYTYAHVVLVLTACTIVVVRYLRSRASFEALVAVWLLANTAFVFCMGHIWGFSGFARACSWALPPLLGAFLPFMPRRWPGWVAIGCVCWGIGFAFYLRGGV